MCDPSPSMYIRRPTQILHINSSIAVIVMRVSFANTPTSLLHRTSTTTTVESFGHHMLPRWAPHACSPVTSSLLHGCRLRPLRPPPGPPHRHRQTQQDILARCVPRPPPWPSHSATSVLASRHHSGGTCERLEKSGAEMMRSILDIDLGIVALASRSTNEAVGRDVNEKMATAFDE